MGTKVQLHTIEDWRRAVIAAVNQFFNSMEAASDEAPAGHVETNSRQEFSAIFLENSSDKIFLITGRSLLIKEEFARPRYNGTKPIVIANSRGTFALSNQDVMARNAFLGRLIDLGFIRSIEEAVQFIETECPIPCDTDIDELARRTHQSFNLVAELEPAEESEFEQVPAISTELIIEEATLGMSGQDKEDFEQALFDLHALLTGEERVSRKHLESLEYSPEVIKAVVFVFGRLNKIEE